MSERIAIIAALQREVSPLVRRWQATELRGRAKARGGVEVHGFSRVNRAGRTGGALAPGLAAYRCGDTLLLIGGIGATAAATAARTALDLYRPALLVSAGFAGSLIPELNVAGLVIPAKVVDALTGRIFVADGQTSEAILVTASSVLSRDSKSALAARFSAQAVDMEAAAVAEVAAHAGIRFVAVKAISDPFDFDMPPLDRFLDSAGKLNLLQLLVYAAPRPRLWRALGQLRRNAARAAEALAGALADLQTRDAALAR